MADSSARTFEIKAILANDLKRSEDIVNRKNYVSLHNKKKSLIRLKIANLEYSCLHRPVLDIESEEKYVITCSNKLKKYIATNGIRCKKRADKLSEAKDDLEQVKSDYILKNNKYDSYMIKIKELYEELNDLENDKVIKNIIDEPLSKLEVKNLKYELLIIKYRERYEKYWRKHFDGEWDDQEELFKLCNMNNQDVLLEELKNECMNNDMIPTKCYKYDEYDCNGWDGVNGKCDCGTLIYEWSNDIKNWSNLDEINLDSGCMYVMTYEIY